MKDADMIRAIAEFDGWKFVPSHDDARGNAVPECWVHDNTDLSPCYGDDPAHYLISLDVIVPVCEKLVGIQQQQYDDILYDITNGNKPSEPTDWYSTYFEVGMDTIFKFINATARQRCEALLRTIGKWSAVERANEKEQP